MAKEKTSKSLIVESTQKSKKIYSSDELIFALDIGTRTVIGVVGVEEKKVFRVLAVEVMEHKSRAMVDGQIHDINQVAEIVQEVKNKLESKFGVRLKRVSIAAAGRVLKTYSVKLEHSLSNNTEITNEIISSLELEGVQKAHSMLESEQTEDEKTVFYCVGYSVVSYYLNGYVISSLLGHKANSIGVEVLATFLPQIVIDSLYTVMNKVGLEVANLTLEPIAAINVSIPQNLRLLNLALVDIGAGTSDIAITKNGAVVGYAMVPIAGDEITEKIAQHYLVDFNTAEAIKISLNDDSKAKVEFTDILGIKKELNKSDVYDIIYDSIVSLGKTIAEKILDYNKKSPNAVFCVGGGSQIKGLTEVIAQNLEIPSERVAVRGREIVKTVKYSGKKISGPEAITPLGIAVHAMEQRENDFINVILNGSQIRLLNAKRLTVADALIITGFDPKQLIGRTSKSVSYTINGERKTVRGEYGSPAIITVNNKPGSVETSLNAGDIINVVPAVDGRTVTVSVRDVVDIKAKHIVFNNKEIIIEPKIKINNKPAEPDTIINDGDDISVSVIQTVADLLAANDLDKEKFKTLVNGSAVENDYIINDGDRIELIEESENHFSKEQEFKDYSSNPDLEIINNQDVVIDSMNSTHGKIFAGNGRSIEVSVNGKNVLLDDNKNNYLFVDIFKSIDFDVSKVTGPISLKINGKSAGYTDKIANGDVLEISWNNN